MSRAGVRRGAGNVWALVLGALVGGVLGLGALLLAMPYLLPPGGGRPTPAEPPASAAQPSSPPVTPAPGTAVSPPARPERDPELQALLEQEAARIAGTPYIHVRVEGGPQAGVRAQEPVRAASVIKLPLMAVVHDAWREGRLERTAADERRMREMITKSDNPSADALMKRVGLDPANSWLAEHGFHGTRIRHRMLAPKAQRKEGDNVVAAADMTRMLLAIAQGTLVDPKASEEMRQLLLDQTRRARIPAGVPDDAFVGNKTGTLSGLVHDAAFIETPNGTRYALAVLISGARREAAGEASIRRVSRKVYEYLTAKEPEAAPSG